MFFPASIVTLNHKVIALLMRVKVNIKLNISPRHLLLGGRHTINLTFNFLTEYGNIEQKKLTAVHMFNVQLQHCIQEHISI